MEKVIKYRCSKCGELFDTPENALAHEIRHERIEKANEMLDEGYTLKQINDECEIWDSVPEHLENVNKDNCFKISYWQCCDKPAYQIMHIFFDGRVNVRGCGSWSGYYGNCLRLDSRDLEDPRPKEELFVDGRYTSRWELYLENIKVEVIIMTSYEFEKAAKNAVIQTLSENISIDQLDLVWFAHELGYKKCTIWGQPMGNRYAEVTYNRDKDEMYVDIYQKIINNKISSDEFNFEA